MLNRLGAALLCGILFWGSANAQTSAGAYPTGKGNPAAGVVQMGLDANNQAWPCGSSQVVYGCGSGGAPSSVAVSSLPPTPAGTNVIGLVQTAPSSVTPTGGNVVLTTTSAIAIPATSTARSIRYLVMGTGYGCASWVTSSITISGNTAPVTCTGAGAFRIQDGSVDARISPDGIPNTPLYALIASGASLRLSSEQE